MRRNKARKEKKKLEKKCRGLARQVKWGSKAVDKLLRVRKDLLSQSYESYADLKLTSPGDREGLFDFAKSQVKDRLMEILLGIYCLERLGFLMA